LKGYPGAKHLLFQARVDLADGYLPVMPMIAMAKGLLNLTDKSQAELIGAVKNLSRSLCYGINLTEDVIDNYINNGVFLLKLPKVECYDYDQLEQLQRQALMVLISA
jgi:diadenosine tetraphosphate (Ap4A) HIT family hydrolase